MKLYARLASATELETSARGLTRTDSQEGDAIAKTELTYSTTGGTSRAKPALGTLIVCIVQVTQYSMFDNLSAQQLRDQYAAYTRAEQATTERLPLPDATPPGLTEDQQSQLFDNWCVDILARSPKLWTEQERNVIRIASARALADCAEGQEHPC